MFNSITVIGLGLIGSSLAHDIRTHRLAERLIGIDPDEAAGNRMKDGKLLDAFYASAEECEEQSDLVIVATPPSTFATLAPQLAPLLSENGILTDTGSTKYYAIETLGAHLPESVTFVPGHPIAGSDKSGAGSGSSGLFLHRRVIITPYHEGRASQFERVLKFWESIGAVGEIMDPSMHDRVYAYMSHLPQVSAYATALTVSAHLSSIPPELAASLRIAGSRPALWRDIVASNAEQMTEAMEFFLYVIGHIHTELASGAPEGTAASADDKAVSELLPRIIASSLISTVALTERKDGQKYARYAGQGFKDMTDIVQASPEMDIERISNSHAQVAGLVDEFATLIRRWTGLVRQGEWDNLEAEFARARDSFAALKAVKH